MLIRYVNKSIVNKELIAQEKYNKILSTKERIREMDEISTAIRETSMLDLEAKERLEK